PYRRPWITIEIPGILTTGSNTGIPKPMRPRLWNPEMELMSHSEMRTLQLVKLKSLLNRVYEQSP
ncbi:MAG: hypothetical protein QGH08_01900, partial [Arenicellales bacterium]|nr:hypothetical protein [Arenicellales bacterium]